MIFEAIAGFFVSLIEAVVNLLPTGNPPGWLQGWGAKVSDVLGYAAGLGAWIPLSLSVTVITALLACIVLGFVIKVVRIVASFFTAGGGSAA